MSEQDFKRLWDGQDSKILSILKMSEQDWKRLWDGQDFLSYLIRWILTARFIQFAVSCLS